MSLAVEESRQVELYCDSALAEHDSERTIAERSGHPGQQAARLAEEQVDDPESEAEIDVEADYRFEKRFLPSLTEVGRGEGFPRARRAAAVGQPGSIAGAG